MGEVVGAGLVAHVPTIMLPEEVRLEINEGKEISLVPGLHRLRSEVIDRLHPERFVLMFFGGEPLLNLPVMYYLAERTWKATQSRGVRTCWIS